MDIKTPRRILFLGAPDAGVLDLIKDLTGSAPTPIDNNSAAGLSHTWSLKTNYYKAELPVWIDDIGNVPAWQKEFSQPEAKEVISSLGAWIYCFRKPVSSNDFVTIKGTMKAIETVIRKAMGFSWDGACLAVSMPQSTTPALNKSVEEWEEICRECQFEYIDSEAKGRDEYGETQGLARLKESIEATDWAADESFDIEDLGDLDDDETFGEGPSGYDAELAEMDSELKGMKTSLALGSTGGDEDDDEAQEEQVEELSSMMTKLQAIKDTGSAMPDNERKRFTAKAVNDLMRSMKP